MHSSRAVAALICVLLIFLIPVSVNADWSMYRGNAAKTGVGTGEPILKPVLLWNQTLNGNVGSPPAVVNGIAYVGSDDGYVYALNASTGSQIWNCSLGHISYSTPAVADGYLFVGSHDHYNIMNSTGDPTPQLPNAYKGYVNAINIQTGENCWNKTFEAYVSAPVVSENIVYVTSDHLYALSETSGQILWSNQVGGLIPSLAVADGIVFTSGPYAYEAVTGHYIWSASRNLYDYPIIANSTVYTTNILGEMAAFKAGTGEDLWNYNLSVWSWSEPAVSNGVLFLGSKQNQLCALNGTNGDIIWNVFMGSHSASFSPVIASDVLYLSYFGGLYAFNTTNGNQLWNYNVTAYGTGQLTDAVVDKGTIYVAAGNSLYAFVDRSSLPQSTISPAIDSVISNNTIIVIIAAIAIIVVVAIMGFRIWQYRKKVNLSI